MRVTAMKHFADDVHSGAYPAPQYLVDSDADVVAQFRDWLDGQ
jgi:3-methyl-2-oxobutanoate hydroxymethyltransferase